MDKWFKKIKPGDKLMAIADWNRTERGGNQLPEPVEILRSAEATSQSKWLFTVRTKNGNERMLDAAWFVPPNVELTGRAEVPDESAAVGRSG